MARLKDIALGRSDLLMIDPRVIKMQDGFNVRTFDPKHDEEDARDLESIRSNGVRTPIMIRMVDDEVVVVDGHRRLSAVNMLINEGITDIVSIPCVPEPRGTSEEDRILSLIITDGKPKTDLQKGEVLKRLVNFGWTDKRMSERTGMSVGRVRGILELMGADREVTELVKDGTIAAGAAIKAIKRSGHKKAANAIKTVAAKAKSTGSKRVTAREVEQAVEGSSEPNEERLNARGKRQISKRDLTKTLRSILETYDVKAIHALAKHTLGMTGSDEEEQDLVERTNHDAQLPFAASPDKAQDMDDEVARELDAKEPIAAGAW